MNKIKIALLVGGVSPESAVSKESSQAIYKALLELGYDTKIIDPGYGLNQPKNPEDFFKQEDYTEKSVSNMFEALTSELLYDIDLVFLGLHGDWGEDGRIQSLLEMRNIKYTGSGVLASALAMDKSKTKIHLKENNVPTANWFTVEKSSFDLNESEQKLSSVTGVPFIVKPNRGGSSVGLSICNSISELKQALELVFKYCDEAIVEQFVAGRELTVGVLGNKILPVLEIKPKNEYYDYECKYTDGMSEYKVPAEIDSEVAVKMQQDAMKAFNAVGCSNYARIDFLMNEKNEYFCLEINTLPGMTSHSLVPKAAAHIGISFVSLIDEIIQLALKDE